MCSISHASTLVSSTSRVAIPSSGGNDASTIWLKFPLFSPPLNLYIRHIASIQCKPAKTEFASFVFNSCIVISKKLGHLAGKSKDNIFCRIGMSCIRTWGDDEASMGRRRFRRSSFSSSGICLCATESSLGCHALVTRFLRYTTAIYELAGVSPNPAGKRTGEAYTVVLLRLQYIQKCIGKPWLIFCLGVGMLAGFESQSARELTYLRSSSA